MVGTTLELSSASSAFYKDIPNAQKLISDTCRGIQRISSFCAEKLLKHRPLFFRIIVNGKCNELQQRKEMQRRRQLASLSLGDFDLGELKASLSKLQLPFWVDLSSPGHPDKKRLMTVYDFFKYTEKEGHPDPLIPSHSFSRQGLLREPRQRCRRQGLPGRLKIRDEAVQATRKLRQGILQPCTRRSMVGEIDHVTSQFTLYLPVQPP